ncbi:MAG TPA: PEGA domain-containing protein [Verrucomicrobiae bacterium]|nr:PEGA domain-containing protein [Verrucomicrobiae bacterium]
MDLSVWYGKHDLGEIKLRRSTGTLAIQSVPAAQRITISGLGYSQNIYDCSGTNILLPTDSYTIQAKYPHWSESRPALVMANARAACSFAPQFGAVQLTCNRTNATFDFRDGQGNRISSGEFPVMLDELPVGSYQLSAEHHQHQIQQSVLISANATNEVPVVFQYGAVSIQSSPSGASVYSTNGEYWGNTPLFYPEVIPQTLHFTLQGYGFETASVEMSVAADATNYAYKELVSVAYKNNMSDAQQNFASGNYLVAISAANQALAAKPNDADAMILRKSADGLLKIQNAKTMAQRGDYIGADSELTNALQILPNNDEAKQLLSKYKPQESDQAAQQAAEQLVRPRKVMDGYYTNNPVAAFFEEHELKTEKPAADVQRELLRLLKYDQPTFKVLLEYEPESQTYEIEALQEITGLLGSGTTAGRRRCVIVCGQTKTNETQILFKVMEYSAQTTIKFSIANLLKTATLDNVSYSLINPATETDEKSKARIPDGVSVVTAKIQQAIK